MGPLFTILIDVPASKIYQVRLAEKNGLVLNRRLYIGECGAIVFFPLLSFPSHWAGLAIGSNFKLSLVVGR